jgi:hypothetical protein
MQQYRLYFIDGWPHQRLHELDAADDAAAISIAEAWREGRKMELWQLARCVKRWN